MLLWPIPSNMMSQTSNPSSSTLAVCSVADRSIWVWNTMQIFCTIWHIWWGYGRLCRGPWVGTPVTVGLHHSLLFAPCVLYHGVLHSVVALSSTSSWPSLAADLMCVTSCNLSPPPQLCHTSSRYHETPSPSVHGRPLFTNSSPPSIHVFSHKM